MFFAVFRAQDYRESSSHTYSGGSAAFSTCPRPHQPRDAQPNSHWATMKPAHPKAMALELAVKSFVIHQPLNHGIVSTLNVEPLYLLTLYFYSNPKTAQTLFYAKLLKLCSNTIVHVNGSQLSKQSVLNSQANREFSKQPVFVSHISL